MSSNVVWLGYPEPVLLGLGLLILLLFVVLIVASCVLARFLTLEENNVRGWRVPAHLKEAQSPVSI